MRVIKKAAAIMLAAGLFVSSVSVLAPNDVLTVQAIHRGKGHKFNKSCPAFRRKMMRALKATNRDTRNLVKALNKYDQIDFKMTYTKDVSDSWNLLRSMKKKYGTAEIQNSPTSAITVHEFAKENKLNVLQEDGIMELLNGLWGEPMGKYDYLYATIQNAALHKRNGICYLTARVTVHAKDRMGELNKSGVGQANLWYL